MPDSPRTMRGILSRTSPNLLPLLRRSEDVMPRRGERLEAILGKHPLDLTALANALVLKNPRLPDLRNPEEYPLLIHGLHHQLTTLKNKKELLLPNLHDAHSIAVFSDYAGDGDESKYLTYSFLFVAYDILPIALGSLAELRRRPDMAVRHREMAFKNLDYGPLERVLPDWLNAINPAPGLLFTVVVDKSVVSMMTRNDSKALGEIEAALRQLGLSAWNKPRVAEKFLRIVHPIAYMAAALRCDDHKIWWMTDNDEIVANEQMCAAAKKIYSQLLLRYSLKPYQLCGFSTQFERIPADTEINYNEMLSFPDLAAGCFANVCTSILKGIGPVKGKSEVIAKWLCDQGIGLKKLNLLVDSTEDGTIATSIINLKTDDPTPDGPTVPVYL